ncbi:MAG: DNA ligase, partial [Verrucomicrobia bacterium]|nr:DNA ligase [Verrucomicrobiota bacterium]
MKVSFDRGIFLPGLDLWLDPWDERPTAFVSHAHADHIGNHQEIILSEITSKLMAARLPGDRIEHRLPFQTPFSFRGATITLLPAGHIFGSAQIHLETVAGSLLYTGDFKLRHGKSAEVAQWRYADTLIMETTYGLPKYVFPPTDRVIHALIKFCIEAVEENQVPVLFGYSLGKAQEILAALNQSNLRILLHPAVYKITKIYEELNQALPKFELYNESLISGSVVICPPNAARTRIVQKIKQRRTAVLTGWALNPGAIHRYQCDAAFPLSDHADYPDLLRLVELVSPKRVLTVHGFAHEFAEDLRRKGVDAWSLGEENQLELVLPLNARKANSVPLSVTQSPVQDGFGRFTATCDEIESLTGKLKKIEILSGYLCSLSTKDLSTVATFLSGRAFPSNSGKTLQVGWAIMRKALMEAAKMSETEFRAISAGYGDAGRVAYEVLFSHPAAKQFQISDIESNFESIQSASGPTAKTKLLRELLDQMGAKEASYVVRILTGDLRIG